jgi:hypothetical protein
VHPAPEEIAGCPHVCGIDLGLREHAPTQEHRDFLGIDFVVFRFAAMDGFQVAGMPKDEGNAFLGTEVSQPVPREETFDSDDDIIPIQGNGPEPRVWTGFHILVYQHLTGLVQDTDVHRPCVQVDPTIRLMLLGVELPEVSSFS